MSSAAACRIALYVRRFWLTRPVVLCGVITPPFCSPQSSKQAPMTRVGLHNEQGCPKPHDVEWPMNDVSIVVPDGGEIIELGPARMRILEDGRTTAHRLGIGEITLAPHSAGPPQHRHAQHDEGFYVVSGTGRFTVGQTVYEAPRG